MKYFIDFEFIEGFHKPLFGKRRHFIDLISVGIVAEDARVYYAISNEFNPKDADQWVKDNVISKLPDRPNADPFQHHAHRYWKSNQQIAKDLIDFFTVRKIKEFKKGMNMAENLWEYDKPEFYGYYADYDWVLFCSLFGRMIDLPDGFPMYCRDLKQMMDEKVANFTNSDFLTNFHVGKPLTFDEKLELYKKGPNFPKQEDEHNALSDATWNKKIYEYLTK